MFAKLVLLAVASIAFAHERGHGPALSGVGPSGGKLTAIIPASEADKAEKASVMGAAEYSVSDTNLNVKLWTLDKKAQASVQAGKMKWILIPKTGKPQVIEADSKQVSELNFQNKELAKLNAVELILPGFNGKNEKHVIYFKLN